MSSRNRFGWVGWWKVDVEVQDTINYDWVRQMGKWGWKGNPRYFGRYFNRYLPPNV